MLKFIAGIRKERKARAGIVHPVTDVLEVNRRFKAEHDRSEHLFHRDNCILGKLVQLSHGDCLFRDDNCVQFHIPSAGGRGTFIVANHPRIGKGADKFTERITLTGAQIFLAESHKLIQNRIGC